MPSIDRSARHAHAAADGYSVQNERRAWPGAPAAYEQLRAIEADLGEPLHIRCSFWGSGSVETDDGSAIVDLPTGPLADLVAFVGPNDEEGS